jgi:UDP-N-acetylmuramoyl-L-alanyl-D-glutamate--2,6-diaminopimelate ligase
MRLGELIRDLDVLELHAPSDPRILGLAYDSRDVRPGWLFAALEGQHTDGHRFAGQAAQKGAVAVLHRRPLQETRPGVAYVRVAEPRRALSELADAFHGRPSRRLEVIGVTGTDGKSTTVFLLHQLLAALGRRSGFLSTVSFQAGGELRPNSLRQSTPEAPEVHALLAEMADAGIRYAVLEATSHGLSERTARLAHVRFQAAVCTNITHEHLEFHGTFEQYRSDKANLFRALDRAENRVSGEQRPEARRFGVANADDPSHAYLAAQTRRPVHLYGVRSAAGAAPPGDRPERRAEAELSAHDFVGDLVGSRFVLQWADGQAAASLALPGQHNVENLLAACLAVHHLADVPFPELVPLFPGLRGVPGRLQPVHEGQPFRVIVDYAHTPEAFARVLPFARAQTPGRLIAVFGSAGERDTAKRPLQGEVASRHCDVLVLADEDPRGEDPRAILREIAAGCRLRPGQELLLEPDRRKAIHEAIRRAGPGDAVLLLGKGHEGSILYDGGAIPWDEAEVAREALRALGYGA